MKKYQTDLDFSFTKHSVEGFDSSLQNHGSHGKLE